MTVDKIAASADDGGYYGAYYMAHQQIVDAVANR